MKDCNLSWNTQPSFFPSYINKRSYVTSICWGNPCTGLLQVNGVPGGWGSQIFRHLAHEGGKVVSPMHRPLLPQEIFLLLISVSGWVDPRVIVWQMQNSNDANFRFVVQCLSQTCHSVPPYQYAVYLSLIIFRLQYYSSSSKLVTLICHVEAAAVTNIHSQT